LIILEWGPFLGDEETRHIVWYRAKPIPAEALYVEAEIVEDPVGEYGMGLHLIVYSKGENYSWDVKLHEETHWGLAMFGDPMNDANYEYLTGLIEENLGLLLTEAHLSMARMVTKAEAKLKLMREIVHESSYVILASHDKTIKVTKELARRMLIKGQFKSILPTRFFRATLDTVVCYDNRNNELGRIYYDPTIKDSYMGLVLLGPGGVYDPVAAAFAD
jgi:hypothetical protein